MTQEEQILNLFDEYFKNTPKSEIEKDVKSISGLGTDGISFEDYVAVLNKVTSFSLIETGICDDIAFVLLVVAD